MILARIARAIREQNWFAVAVEFIIVVAGVMLAFQATLWNETRQNAQRQSLFFERLASDFAQIEIQAASVEATYLDVANATSRVIAFLESGDTFSPEYPESAFRADLNRMMQGTAPVESSPTFQELQSGGLMHFVEDDAVREALTAFHLQVRRTQEVWTIFVGMQMDYARPLMPAMRFSDVVISDDGTDDLGVGMVDLDRFRSDPAVIGSLTMIRRAHIYNLAWQRDVAEQAELLSRMLGNEPPEAAAP